MYTMYKMYKMFEIIVQKFVSPTYYKIIYVRGIFYYA